MHKALHRGLTRSYFRSVFRYRINRCRPKPERTGSATKSGSKGSPNSPTLTFLGGRTVKPLTMRGSDVIAPSVSNFGASPGGLGLGMDQPSTDAFYQGITMLRPNARLDFSDD